MRAVSFLPAATTMLQQLGLSEHLYGQTFECPGDAPVIVHSALEDESLSSSEIHEKIQHAAATGESVYSVNQDELSKAAPDVVFTQQVCNVCQIGEDETREAVQSLTPTPEVIPLSPKTLNDVWSDIETVAHAVGAPEKGEEMRQAITQDIQALRRCLENEPKRRIFFMEWPDPVFHAGHWIPEMIEAAGGFDPLGRPGGKSGVVNVADIAETDPEVMIAAPCGLSPSEAETEVQTQLVRPEWQALRAVKNNEVYTINADLFTQPGIDLIEGIYTLARLLHPNLLLPAMTSRNVRAKL
ncbi:iron complex transport system substrate-binding protein [Salsuginibacillus halophilus]|uniref:Iron complex transport system substrate-binding protein n=1 Tax=Salsuginibacillus halophilus TaxID=517424 RepID=A0A2P8HLG8_9BACI|nr:ABC transporter substrate-binding protein [Salsuginibacillus halophilus]PSL47030.1 iron complex transport system substrate-binding protein [Salsuginibacillus halophilus]